MKHVERRRTIAMRYQQGLCNLSQLSLPPSPVDDPRHFDVYQNYELQADCRDDLRSYLDSRGINTIIQWAGTPVHRFTELGFTEYLPKTDAFFERCLMLPMNTAITDDEVDDVIQNIQNFYSV